MHSRIEQSFYVNLMTKLTLAILFTLPLIHLPGFGSYSAFRYYVFGATTIVLGIATAWIWIRIRSIPKSFFGNWLNYGMLIYFGAFVLASIFSIDPVASFWSTFHRTNGVFTLLFIIIFVLNIFTLTSIKGKPFFYQLLKFSVFGATSLSVLIMLFYRRSEGTWFSGALDGATVGNSSLAAAYILWNIFFAIILYRKGITNNMRIVWGSLLGLMVFSPLFIKWGPQAFTSLINTIGIARGAVLGLAFGLVVALAVWLILQSSKTKKYLGIGLATSVLISISILGFQLFILDSTIRSGFVKAAGATRFIFWDISYEAFKERPILGWGPNTYHILYHKFYDPQMTILPEKETWVDRTHNLEAETLVNGGLVLLLSLVFFISTIFIGIFKARKSEQLSSLEAGLLFGSISAWILQNQFVFDSPLSLTMLFMSAGIISVLNHSPEKMEYKAPTLGLKWLYNSTILFFLVLFIFTIALPYKKNRMMYSADILSIEGRRDYWSRLDKGFPMGQGYDSVLLLKNLYATYAVNEENIKKESNSVKKTLLDELEAIGIYLSNAVERNKKISNEHALLGARFAALQMNIANKYDGAVMDRAVFLSNAALELSPTNPESYWIAATIQSMRGDVLETKKILEKAFELQPRAAQTHYMILQVAKKTKDDDYYQSSLTRAQQFIPNFREQ